MWCWAFPSVIVGGVLGVPQRDRRPDERVVGLARAARDHLGAEGSVPMRPLGPCCSKEPIGTTMLVSR